MNDRYYVFNEGRKRGPFSLDDLLDEIECGQVEYEDFCLRIGSTTCEKIREVLDWEDEHFIQASSQPSEDLLEPDTDARNLDEVDEIDEVKISDEAEDIEEPQEQHEEEETPEFEEDDDENEEEDYEETFSDEDDEYLAEDEAFPAPAQSLPPQDSTTILYSGRPSLLSYPKSLLMVALSLGAGFCLRGQFDWILFAGFTFALFFFVQAQLRRSRHQYFITPKRVEVIYGLILEDSREIRIEDLSGSTKQVTLSPTG